MEILARNPYARPFDLTKHVEALTVSKDDQDLIDEVIKERLRLYAVASPYARDGRKAMKLAAYNLGTEPSAENAKAYAQAVIAEDKAVTIYKGIQAALAGPHNVLADRLIPVALKAADDLEKSVRKSTEDHRKLLAKSPVATESGAADNVEVMLKSTVEYLDGIRTEIKEGHRAIYYLSAWGIIDEAALIGITTGDAEE